MPKLGFEKLAGIVAVSYLVIIPLGAYYLLKRTMVMDQDLLTLCEKQGITPTEMTLFGNGRKIARVLPEKGPGL